MANQQTIDEIKSTGQLPACAGLKTDDQLLHELGAYQMLQAGSGSGRQELFTKISNTLKSLQLTDPGTYCAQQNGSLDSSQGQFSLAVGGARQAVAIAGGIPVIGQILGAAQSIFSVFFGAHAAKVTEEKKILCAAVPAANASIKAILAALADGKLTEVQAYLEIQKLHNEYRQTVAPVFKQANWAGQTAWELTFVAVKIQNQLECGILKSGQHFSFFGLTGGFFSGPGLLLIGLLLLLVIRPARREVVHIVEKAA